MIEKDLKKRFAISPHFDLEIDVGGLGIVGLTADVPHGLREDITATIVAAKLGLSSIDYARKKYLGSLAEHIPRDAEAREIVA